MYDHHVRQQLDIRWGKDSGYNKRWVFSEGIFSNFKRKFGEEVICKTYEMIELELMTKVMLYNMYFS